MLRKQRAETKAGAFSVGNVGDKTPAGGNERPGILGDIRRTLSISTLKQAISIFTLEDVKIGGRQEDVAAPAPYQSEGQGSTGKGLDTATLLIESCGSSAAEAEPI